MKNFNFKLFVPDVVAVAVFLLITLIYFSPVLEGYSLRMGDMQGVSGMNKELIDFDEANEGQAIWTNSMFGGMPGYAIYFNKVNPINSISKFLYNLLNIPVYPFFAAFVAFYTLARVIRMGYLLAFLGAIAYGFSTYNLLIIEAGHITKLLAIAFFPFVLAGVFMVYRFKNYFLAMGFLAFFSGVEIMVNHIQMSYYFVFILMIIVISEFLRFQKNKETKVFLKKTSLVVLSAVIGLLVNFTNYYFLYNFSKETIRGKTELTISPSSSLKSTINEKTSSGLDRDYIVQWSYGIQETINLAIPLAKGKNDLINDYFDYLAKNSRSLSQEAYKLYQNNQGRVFTGYWGNQPFTSGPNYIGAIFVFLALLYFILINKPLKWLLLGLSILVIMLSWGKNLGGSVENMWLTNFFIDYIPLYSKFRAVSSILVVINFVVPFISVLFLKELFQNSEWANSKLKQIITTSFGIIGGFSLLYLFPTSFLDFLSNNEELIFSKLNNFNVEESIINFRIDVFKNSALRSILLMITTFGCLILFIKNYLKSSHSILILIALVVFDFWSVDKQFLNNEKNPKNKRQYIKWEKVKGKTNRPNSVQADHDIFKIEASVNPELNSTVLKRVKESKNRRGRSLTNLMKEDEKFAALNFSTNYRVLELDNPFNSSRASYFHKSTGGYSPAKLRRYQDLIDFYISKELSYLSTGNLQDMKVLNMLNNKYYMYQGKLLGQNKYAFGNAWFVNNVKWVANPDEEILSIKNTDLKNTAIINNKFKDNISESIIGDSLASINMLSYQPNHISYESKTSQNGQLAVFSEIYYKDGWNAYIDGNKVNHLQVNYVLRALPVPIGIHSIDFKFEPKGILTGSIISIISFLLIVVFVFLGYKKGCNEPG